MPVNRKDFLRKGGVFGALAALLSVNKVEAGETDEVIYGNLRVEGDLEVTGEVTVGGTLTYNTGTTTMQAYYDWKKGELIAL